MGIATVYHITYTFQPLHEPIHGRHVHALGLHGMLFNIAGQADREETNWLHGHDVPRPFSLVPLYTEDGILTGMRLSAFTERVATLFTRTGEWFQKEARPCHLGGREFIIQSVRCTPGPNWQQLAMTEPSRQVGLRFRSPTAFRQGPGHLPLPLPANVFTGPARVWQTFAPPLMAVPDGWLAWCASDIFVTEHNIETARVTISKGETFTGFVGDVWFAAHQGEDLHLSVWQALADLAAFTGVGHKTTMGLGAVERIP